MVDGIRELLAPEPDRDPALANRIEVGLGGHQHGGDSTATDLADPR